MSPFFFERVAKISLMSTWHVIKEREGVIESGGRGGNMLTFQFSGPSSRKIDSVSEGRWWVDGILSTSPPLSCTNAHTHTHTICHSIQNSWQTFNSWAKGICICAVKSTNPKWQSTVIYRIQKSYIIYRDLNQFYRVRNLKKYFSVCARFLFTTVLGQTSSWG